MKNENPWKLPSWRFPPPSHGVSLSQIKLRQMSKGCVGSELELGQVQLGSAGDCCYCLPCCLLFILRWHLVPLDSMNFDTRDCEILILVNVLAFLISLWQAAWSSIIGMEPKLKTRKNEWMNWMLEPKQRHSRHSVAGILIAILMIFNQFHSGFCLPFLCNGVHCVWQWELSDWTFSVNCLTKPCACSVAWFARSRGGRHADAPNCSHQDAPVLPVNYPFVH